MPDLYPLARQLFWRLQPETAHKVALYTLRIGLGFLASSERLGSLDHPALAQSLWGLNFRNPVGIAAGFDKDALVPDPLLKCGFGAVEVGTVTPQEQYGNLKPRLFRLDQDQAIINRMGFPSAGLETIAKRIARHKKRNGILGVNLGKNKNTVDVAADYVEGLRLTASLADYVVINISSPNTPGLRDLQRGAPLRSLMKEMIDLRDQVAPNLPLLIKIAPDLSHEELIEIAEVVLELGIDGIVISNTTVARPSTLKSFESEEQGGLSGPQLFELSTTLLAEMYRLTSGRVPLIGVGGISSAEDAYIKIRAGASLVQIHSALIFSGLSLVSKIKAGLLRLLLKDGFSKISDAIGVDHSVNASNGHRQQRVALTLNSGSSLSLSSLKEASCAMAPRSNAA